MKRFTQIQVDELNGKIATANIIQADYLEENNSMIPVIYQPRVDTWENFLREVHVYENPENNSFEITLAFQDEDLRKHRIVDGYIDCID